LIFLSPYFNHAFITIILYSIVLVRNVLYKVCEWLSLKNGVQTSRNLIKNENYL